MTTIGFLITGQHFDLNGRRYRVGHLIENTNGYVSCVDVIEAKKKTTRFHIDTMVEPVREEK